MKKILAMVLALSMLFAFTACDKDEKSKEKKKEIATAEVEKTDEKEDIEGQGTVNEKADAVAVDEVEVVEEVPEEETTNEKFSLGAISGKVYENKFIGLRFTLPDSNWKYYSDAEIAQMSNITEDLLAEEYDEVFKNTDVVYSMMAQTSNGNNVNVAYEELSGLGKMITEKQYVDTTAPKLKDAYESALGATDVVSEVTTAMVGGKTFQAIKSQYNMSGVDVYQLQFVVKREGLVAITTISSFGSDKTADILSSFEVM